ncbi:hypothetical protein BC629DRAFT_1529085 [Irpex lacteus]|nr:hypothetical protein BC629DRAFT_1529085 [Irpex lacteus]
MSKAERRELQEKQRAAKAAAKAAGTSQPSQKPAAKQPPISGSSNATPKKGGKPVDPAPPRTPATPSGRQPRDAKMATTTLTETGPINARGLRIFSHFGLPKPVSLAKGDIHPVILRLALQFSDFKITGANARCIATLTAFKTVIQDYHLMTHLSPQISHLVAARPMSVTMGNAIRQLKLEISGSDIDLPEQDAKDALCRKIDDYIRDRIMVAVSKIRDGDVILTYAVVEKVYLGHSEGRQFSVVVVDSRPCWKVALKRLLSVLTEAGIQCSYSTPSPGAVITEVSMVLVGAHSITPMDHDAGKQHSVPVVVCCETYKFSEGVQLDSFTKNELAPLGDKFASFPLTKPREALTLVNGPNLEILNPLYDLTPPTSYPP